MKKKKKTLSTVNSSTAPVHVDSSTALPRSNPLQIFSLWPSPNIFTRTPFQNWISKGLLIKIKARIWPWRSHMNHIRSTLATPQPSRNHWFLHLSLYLSIHLSIALSIYFCIHVCMYVCMHVCMYLYLSIYLSTQTVSEVNSSTAPEHVASSTACPQALGLGSRVQDLGFRVWGLGFMVKGLWFRV